ncbi:DUF1080 domain-containing protein [Halieaceae bacterium]|nr:DUF1080 domain-containing protein [Halieaceae bacterium]
MRKRVLKTLLILLVVLVAVAGFFYQRYYHVGQYSYSGSPVLPPSATVDDSAAWISLFDGESLVGWRSKFVGSPVDENYRDSFRVSDGAITVSYDNYDAWDGEFGHLFFERPFDNYILQLQYRFIGEQATDAPAMAWAWRNSGVMLHSQAPETMGLKQDFPVSVEVQLLGAHEGEHRPTGNLCTPGTHVRVAGEMHTQHCMLSTSTSIVGDEWVQLEVEVRSNRLIRHFINGELVLEYSAPQLDGWNPAARDLLESGGSRELQSGYIALQSESHPVQFRNIRLLELD